MALGLGGVALPSSAQSLNVYCQVTQAEATAKEELRRAA
ncbi:MAG: hypothetical protein RLZZ597_2251, partial [Cyanobacteriota bacterium]